MRVLILHMRYAPDATGTGPLVTQLAQDLASLGEQVSVITAVPHYGRSGVPAEYRQGLFSQKREAGVDVWRTAAFPYWSGRVLGRAIDYLLYTALAFWAGLQADRPDVILAVAPPISVGALGRLLALLRRAPLVFNAQDIWPDGLIQMGRLRSRLAIALFRRLESWIYQVADMVVVVSEGMRQNLLKKGTPDSKVQVVPNWVDLDQIFPVPRDNPFSREHSLGQSFIVLFAGNLGYAANLEILLETAALCRQETDMIFLLVGEGSAKSKLEHAVQERGLDNVRFLPTQPVDRVSEMLGASDLSLVTLRPRMGGLSVPSKTYAYMASGRPILAAVPSDSAIQLLIDQAGCGRNVPADDPTKIARTIVEMKRLGPELAEMGRRGRQYAEKNCGREVAVEQYRHLLQSLADGDN